MYFIVIMAFAFLLSDMMPPERFNLLATSGAVGEAYAHAQYGTLAIIAAQLAIVTIAALLSNRMTLNRLDGTHRGFDRAANRFSDCQRVILGLIAAALVLTMLLTPWARLVRDGWGLRRLLLVDDLIILSPFVGSLLVMWIVQYPAELSLRLAAHDAPDDDDPLDRQDQGLENPDTEASRKTGTDAAAALQAAQTQGTHPTASLATFVFDKFRHQLLIIAAPMMIIVAAKHFTDHYRSDIVGAVGVPWAADSLLACISACVLAFAPVMLRFIWATESLPGGPFRDRLMRICERLRLRYRDILLWHTHGLTVNAAVMGFIAPMRYILVSDALLETMEDEEIEAVFGHEAGHVRHFHLQYFLLFVLLTMYVTGGVAEVLARNRIVTENGTLQMISLGVLLACWLFGFGWLSRKFERQADLYGVRTVTKDAGDCDARCVVHGGGEQSNGICVRATRLFGATLYRIADLNGIPREAPSWRHGSIQSRCDLLERMCDDPAAVRRFDRKLIAIKIAMLLAAVLGTGVAIWLYWPEISRALAR